MANLFTERNNMREQITKTSNMTKDVYVLIIRCCEKYFINLAKQFPEFCPDDERNICGADIQQIHTILRHRIPALFTNQYSLNSLIPSDDEYDQYAALDLIEFIAQYMVTLIRFDYHSFFRHDHIKFSDSNEDFVSFKNDINGIFEMAGLQYKLTDSKIIERITEADYLIEEAKSLDSKAPELGLRNLLYEAISLYLRAKPSDHHLATEKIWDALERLKSMYVNTEIDKKKSIAKIVQKVSAGVTEFQTLFDIEYQTLTKFGNDFRIRHHEIGKTDIPNDDLYDYFFNRCLALIVLTIKSL